MRSDLSGSTPMVREGVLTVAIAVAPLVVVRIGQRLIEHYVTQVVRYGENQPNQRVIPHLMRDLPRFGNNPNEISRKGMTQGPRIGVRNDTFSDRSQLG